MTQLFALEPKAGKINLSPVNVNPKSLPVGYTNLVTVELNKKQLLYAYNSSKGVTDVFLITDSTPVIQPVLTGLTGLNLMPWDILRSFTLGNKQYLMTYQATSGTLGFYEINDDYSVSKPYTFMNQRSWPTQGFTEVTPFVCVGLIYVVCYDGNKGTVAIFNLNVVSESGEGVPPLNMQNSWYHLWAKGWENFTFFQLGSSNFFFKINKDKLNVNIDHILDIPAQGSVEIGSHLEKQMPNALDVVLSVYIPWKDGEPYMANCDKNNVLNIYRIHGNCKGWTKLHTSTINKPASLVSFTIDDKSYLLTYA